MFTQADYDKLNQIMEESPEKKELLSRLLETHRMEISSISHELRNPLTLVYSTLQLIESRHPEVLAYEHWETMRCDIEYMNQLLQELSAYNNCERLTFETIHTINFLKLQVLSFAASLDDTNIEFTSRIEPGLPDICGDRLKLRQILLNLLGNARDAVSSDSDSLSTPPLITFHARTEDRFLLITIKDNGCGILPEQMDTIFNPFVTYKKNGTGLGLAIAHRIASAHGGRLTVSSEPGIMTEFTLLLPI